MSNSREKTLLHMHNIMLEHFGPSHWWPGETPFEIAVGAVLTQNTQWRNVETAIARLKALQALTPLALWRLSQEELEEAVRPSGYFRQKAVKLRNLAVFLRNIAGTTEPPNDASLSFLQEMDTHLLRKELLAINGVGPETADSILLYALSRESFVVDAYTRRIYSRHGLLPDDVEYDELRDFFMDVLPANVPLYNEYHALIVRTGHAFCKKTKPLCATCPLGCLLEYAVE